MNIICESTLHAAAFTHNLYSMLIVMPKKMLLIVNQCPKHSIDRSSLHANLLQCNSMGIIRSSFAPGIIYQLLIIIHSKICIIHNIKMPQAHT